MRKGIIFKLGYGKVFYASSFIALLAFAILWLSMDGHLVINAISPQGVALISSSELVHQRFIKNGQITGIPNFRR